MTGPRVFGAQLPSWPRKGTTVDEIVLHESVTGSRTATVNVLKARGLSVHVIIDRDGSVTWHADPTEQCAHAGGRHNRRSIGVEVVNRYYGAQAGPNETTIPAVWAHRGVYIVPTLAQMEATWQVVLDLHERHSRSRLRLLRVHHAARPRPPQQAPLGNLLPRGRATVRAAPCQQPRRWRAPNHFQDSPRRCGPQPHPAWPC